MSDYIPQDGDNKKDSSDNADKQLRKPPTQKEHLKEPWLEKYREVRTITTACKAVRVDRKTVAKWRRDDPGFAEKFIEIETELVEILEANAFKRALEGSDLLTIFLLKANNPQKYRDLVKHEVELRFVSEVSARVITVIKRHAVDECPNCKTHFGMTNKIARELESLSAKMGDK